jgi:hypothetical protein
MNTSTPAPIDDGTVSEARHRHRPAVSTGALAIGALAIGRLVIGRARIRRLEIDDLIVRKLQLPSDREPGR